MFNKKFYKISAFYFLSFLIITHDAVADNSNLTPNEPLSKRIMQVSKKACKKAFSAPDLYLNQPKSFYLIKLKTLLNKLRHLMDKLSYKTQTWSYQIDTWEEKSKESPKQWVPDWIHTGKQKRSYNLVVKHTRSEALSETKKEWNEYLNTHYPGTDWLSLVTRETQRGIGHIALYIVSSRVKAVIEKESLPTYQTLKTPEDKVEQPLKTKMDIANIKIDEIAKNDLEKTKNELWSAYKKTYLNPEKNDSGDIYLELIDTLFNQYNKSRLQLNSYQSFLNHNDIDPNKKLEKQKQLELLKEQTEVALKKLIAFNTDPINFYKEHELEFFHKVIMAFYLRFPRYSNSNQYGKALQLAESQYRPFDLSKKTIEQIKTQPKDEAFNYVTNKMELKKTEIENKEIKLLYVIKEKIKTLSLQQIKEDGEVDSKRKELFFLKRELLDLDSLLFVLKNYQVL